MATEPLSTRISTQLMAQVRAEIETSQTTLTATVTRLLTAGLAAEATSALLSSRLEAADAELTRLKAANNSTSLALSVPTKADNGFTVFANADRFDDPYFSDRQADRYSGIRAIVAERQRLALRCLAVGAALFMIALVPMPYDWWFPQLIAKVSMGGSGIESGARLAGYDNGVQMLNRFCPMFEKAMAEYEADNRKAEAENKRKAAKTGATKRKTARRTAKGQQ